MKFFSRIIAILLGIIAIFQSGDPSRVTVVTQDITTKDTVIEYRIENYSGRTITYGYDFSLYKLEGNEWKIIPWAEENGGNFIEIAIRQGNLSSSQTYKIDLTEYFGDTLTVGKYKIEKSIFINGIGKQTVSCNFEVTI